MGETFTEAELRQFVEDWYRALDVHVPPEAALAMVANEGLEFHIPEGIKRGHAGFGELYHHWTHTFFDEVHTVKSTSFEIGPDKTDAKVVVNWQAKVWNPPAAKSEDLNFDAYQTWVLTRSPASGKPVIYRYIVDELVPVGAAASQ